MPSLRYSDRAISDLARIADLLAREEPDRAPAAVAHVMEAIRILERHPLIGRIADDPLRELVISHGRSGYVALYRYDRRRDRIVVKAIRHQRESGFEES